ncbi:hypothetical protein Y1Q_0018590 [Alligator mississippiensis]|uniref:TYRO protein tyrosine kinase-binding protein n=1 Tax=Alligator mississippiensis TaxID=8496 RepID=A0A151NCE7_ALLMI|nr:hypothetical protein Y1Q_0018590 [Alligator mississippiensis]
MLTSPISPLPPAGCDRCYQLSPGLIAGVVGIDLLIIILFNVGAQCLLRRGQQQSQAAKGDMRSSHILEMESNYEELQGQTQDIYSTLEAPTAGIV